MLSDNFMFLFNLVIGHFTINYFTKLHNSLLQRVFVSIVTNSFHHQTCLRHPGSASARENRDTVFCQMRRAMDLIHYVVRDGLPGHEEHTHEVWHISIILPSYKSRATTIPPCEKERTTTAVECAWTKSILCLVLKFGLNTNHLNVSLLSNVELLQI